MRPPDLHLGTSSWSSPDWEGVFYPPGIAPSDYLACYASRYDTVEVDATFYRIPAPAMTKKWRQALPEGFTMSAKAPRVITHDRLLTDCSEELAAFLAAMDHLEDRLGILLFQFPYFSKASGTTLEDFLPRLQAFLPLLPEGYRFAVEIRNKGWLVPRLRDLLAQRGVALALIDHPWMPRIDAWMETLDPVTAGFVYVRWLGDRRGIEQRTQSWDRLIVDRSREMRQWVPAIRSLLSRRVAVFGYFNNHYAGHAPGSIDLFDRTWDEMALSDPAGSPSTPRAR